MARNRDNEATKKKPAQAKTAEAPAEEKAGSASVAQTGKGPEPVGAGHRNTQIGTVVKAKMHKTVVVAVERLVQHDMYRKTIKRTSTFLAHDDKGAKAGDRVRIVETRPLSRHKRWRVEEILTRGLAEDVPVVPA